MTRIRLLGAVEAHRDGTAFAVNRPLVRGVFALLALQAGEPVGVERIIDAVWDEASSDDARGLVHGYVSALRKMVRPAGIGISRRGPGYVLDVARDDVDVLLFRSLAARGRLRDALALWRGEPLSGTPRTTFFDGLRTTLTEERLVAAEGWVEQELAEGRHREVLPELTALVTGNPLREKLVAALMRALYRNGRQADALRCYEITRARLADELGLDPSGELRSLHELVLRADEDLLEPAPAAPEPVRPRNTLPLDTTNFTGRARELGHVLDELPGPGATAVVLIDGMPGVGKTALAVQLAQRLGDRYPDAQLFADLHGFTAGREPVDPFSALDVLLRSLGVPAAEIPNDLDQRVVAWRTELSSRRAVVVLDNAADSDQVRPLLAGARGCLVIVTSRRRLRSLPGTVLLSLDALPDDEALALLSRMLGERVTAEPEAARELVRSCGGLPLALRIAAARLQHRPQWMIEDVVERLRDSGQDEVAAAFALSYRDLGGTHQGLFRLLGLHPGADLDAHAAAALAGVPFRDADEVLEDLLDLHLVEQRTRGRYLLHDLVRDHVRSITEPDAGATARLLDYYLHVAHFAADLLQPGRREPGPAVAEVPDRLPRLRDNRTAMNWFTAERPNLVAVSRFAVASGFDRVAAELPVHTGHFLMITERVDDLVAVQEPAAEAARRLGDPVSESRSQYHLALTRYMQCRYRAGLAHADRTLSLARQVGDQARESMALVVQGMLRHRLGDHAGALAAYETALPIQQHQNNYRHAAICIANQGRVHLSLGALTDAREHLEKALIKSREIGEHNEEGSVLAALGAVHARRGEHDRAAALLDEALSLAREAGNTHYEMRALIKSADARRRAGDLAAASAFGEQAMAMLGHGRSADFLAAAHNVLGDIAFDRGDLSSSVTHHTRARELAGRIEYRAELEAALAGLARARS
ncbi:AfsR/SARP family transcriptional regulator [Lentzea aerocolonigenes]|uniref:AfsR/SARP family transcriptional regulator n=1 Tax=Lentzea aerocolonigenes TaxID=68170 RepID=UPI000697EDE8|nr:AfsR/SARP family transcriptional regulator [Lentzea aerocolonigenes]